MSKVNKHLERPANFQCFILNIPRKNFQKNIVTSYITAVCPYVYMSMSWTRTWTRTWTYVMDIMDVWTWTGNMDKMTKSTKGIQ